MIAITRQFLDLDLGESLELRLHWIRHVVATAFLKAYPGAYDLCARLLNDAEETIRRVYGHLDNRDGFRLYNASADAMFKSICRGKAAANSEAAERDSGQELERARAELTNLQEELGRSRERIAELETQLAAVKRAA